MPGNGTHNIPSTRVICTKQGRSERAAFFLNANLAIDSKKYNNISLVSGVFSVAKSKGTRLKQIGVDDEIVERLIDFREAYWEASEVRIIQEALTDFMDKWLDAEPERRKRYEAARNRRKGEVS